MIRFNKRQIAVALALVSALGFAGAEWALYRTHVVKPKCYHDQREKLRVLSQQICGAVVYERDLDNTTAVCKTVIGSPKAILLTKDGRYPRWAPDGRHVAFLRGNRVMLMTSRGTEARLLFAGTRVRSIAFHPNGTDVIISDADTIKAVSIKDGASRILAAGYVFAGADISADGRRLLAGVRGHKVIAFDLPGGSSRELGQGCSAGLSPDGATVVHNTGRHLRLVLRHWSDGERVGVIGAPPGHQFDNVSWSNHADWLVSRTEMPKQQNVYLHYIPGNRADVLTFTGDCNRPDLFVYSTGGGLKAALWRWRQLWIFV